MRFDEFEGCQEIRIGFKTTEHSNPNEHWMNKLSVRATRHRDDIEPCGTICHAEIMLQVSHGEWKRWSIAKKTRVRDEFGNGVWKPGRVHCKPIDMLNDDYVFIKIAMSRQTQKDVYDFLQSQVGGEFNTVGYWLNFMCPCSIGTRRYMASLQKTKQRWYCTELITAALQAGKARVPIFCLSITNERAL